jgi:hypothetical protein
MKTIDRRSLSVIGLILLIIVALALTYDLVIAPRLGNGTPPQFGPFGNDEGPWGTAQGPFAARGLGVLVRALAGVTATVGVGSVALFFAPKQLMRTVGMLDQQRGITMITGITALVGGGLLAALAIVSLTAAIFAPLIGLTLLLASAWGLLAVALRLGQAVRNRLHGEPNPSTDLVIGVLMLALVALVPFVGRIMLFIAACWGVGAVVRWKAGQHG